MLAQYGPNMRIFSLLLVAVLAAASPSPAPSAAPAPVVHMHGFAFVPSSLTITAGTAVRFVNDDAATHDVTADAFKSGPVDQGKSWTYTFASAGTYTYICSYHPSMHGTIVVQAAP